MWSCLAEYTVPGLSPCYDLLTALVLLNSVARWCNTTQFLQYWCNFTCLCAWASEGLFPLEHKWIFPNVFLRGAKSGDICFLPLETKKTAFFPEVFKFLPLFPHPRLCVGKRSCCTTKKLVQFEAFQHHSK